MIVYVDGELALQQKEPNHYTELVRAVYNSSLFEDPLSAADLSLPVLFQRYYDRNETTVYQYGKPLVFPYGLKNTVEIKLKVRIPTAQPVEYRPRALEALKYAWVQYFSLLVPVAYFLFLFAKFIYGNQILESTVSYDSNKFKNY